MNDRINPEFLKKIESQQSQHLELQSALDKFKSLSPTVISSHDSDCCRVGQKWFSGLSKVHNAISSLPSPWMRSTWEWGPLERPIHWCQIVKKSVLDCGTLSALTIESLAAVGQKSFSVQMVQMYSEDMVQDFEHMWRDEGGGYWTHQDLVYHECVAVINGEANLVKVWDPTVETFSDGSPAQGHDSIVAIKVIDRSNHFANFGHKVIWKGQHLDLNVWNVL
jgi:hypothetical protein